jgi:crotonobetainyl-CoA:carnitine CoA-transferase CaiB-like acyl-CoA transferase
MRLSGELACYRVYRCGDGKYATVGALEPQFWAALCKALGVPEFIERQAAPIGEQDEMAARIQEILLTRSRDEWVKELGDLDACFGPVNDIGEAFQDPQVRARGMVAEVPTRAGPKPALGTPIKLRGFDPQPYRPAPGLGEHTDEVLSAAGYSGEEIGKLRADGAV